MRVSLDDELHRSVAVVVKADGLKDCLSTALGIRACLLLAGADWANQSSPTRTLTTALGVSHPAFHGDRYCSRRGS
jgi:hypothetical protein